MTDVIDLHLDHEGLHPSNQNAVSTVSHRKVDPFNAKPEDICIEDISHALARQCRYNGHVGHFLSVARHSIWVSQLCSPELALTGLLHDASEAYLGDLVKPLKYRDDMQVFRDAEVRLEAVIAEVFGLPNPLPDEVKEADRYVTVELELGEGQRRWTWQTSPRFDQQAFLTRYDMLTRSAE